MSEKQDNGRESPTTARPLDFDDDQQETGIIVNDNSTTDQSTPARSSSRSQSRVHFTEEEDEEAPAKPPRPLSPNAQAEHTLIEAFPTIDAKVIKAVLVASGGQVEPAFNALLGMSDPDAAQETPPPKPPRPTAQQRQLEQDEMYARQLAEHYNSSTPTPSYGPPRGQGPPLVNQGYNRPSRAGEDSDDKEHSFFDDDLPEIRENLRQGFQQTQTKFNKWISDFRKNFNESDEDEPVAGRASAGRRQDFGPSQSDQLYGIQKNAEVGRARRSQDQHRYDPDPQVMTGDFDQLELRDDEEQPPAKPARPQANPDLFKSTPQPPQSGPVDEVDALYSRPGPTNRQPSPVSGKSKKWQPLTSTGLNPDVEEDDPFALGDSEDEDKKKDIMEDATARLKKSASNAEAPSKEDGHQLKLEPSERSGSIGQNDKEVEDLVTGKKGAE